MSDNEPMPVDPVAPILHALLERTRSRTISRETTDQDNAFLSSLPTRPSFMIRRVVSAASVLAASVVRGKPIVEHNLRILDDKGDVVESRQSSNEKDEISQLWELARRQALNIDMQLATILDDLTSGNSTETRPPRRPR
jgi:hypothetical protein